MLADIDIAARAWPEAHRVLADGDAYGLPTKHCSLFARGYAPVFPLQRVSAYATPFNILHKSADEITALKNARLTLVYLGLESGSDVILKKIVKGSSKQMEAALRHARETALKVSATVILGLGGTMHWRAHAEETASLVNRQPPTYLSTLQLVLDPALIDRFLERYGEPFHPQNDRAVLEELRVMIENLAPPSPVIFRSNHASNALPLAGTLPKDRNKLLTQIDQALSGYRALRPELLRGL
ncbi:Radical SAM protein [Azospirillaceae bacterium]